MPPCPSLPTFRDAGQTVLAFDLGRQPDRVLSVVALLHVALMLHPHGIVHLVAVHVHLLDLQVFLAVQIAVLVVGHVAAGRKLHLLCKSSG